MIKKTREKRILKAIPDDWAKKLYLQDSAIAIISAEPNSIKIKAAAHYACVFFAPQTIQRISTNSNLIVTGLAPIGSIEIIPKGCEIFSQWEGRQECLLFSFSDERLIRLANTEFHKDEFQIHPPRIGHVDAKALEISRSIRNEVQADEVAVHECIDAWLTIFGVHLLREYSSLGGKSVAKPRGGLSPWVWRRIEEYIEEHLSRKIHLGNLAEIAQLSPSHFARSFRESTGQSPHQHIIKTRLDLARKLAVSTHFSFEEIAKTCGFSSNSHMTSTMKKFWGMSPKEIRRSSNKNIRPT